MKRRLRASCAALVLLAAMQGFGFGSLCHGPAADGNTPCLSSPIERLFTWTSLTLRLEGAGKSFRMVGTPKARCSCPSGREAVLRSSRFWAAGVRWGHRVMSTVEKGTKKRYMGPPLRASAMPILTSSIGRRLLQFKRRSRSSMLTAPVSVRHTPRALRISWPSSGKWASVNICWKRRYARAGMGGG